MLTVDEIKSCVAKGVAEYNATVPEDRRIVRVELFGSYADGRQAEESDIDLLVEFATEEVSLFNIAAALMAMEEATCSDTLCGWPFSSYQNQMELREGGWRNSEKMMKRKGLLCRIKE